MNHQQAIAKMENELTTQISKVSETTRVFFLLISFKITPFESNFENLIYILDARFL